MRVLIIEDEFLIRECLSRVAKSKGHCVKTTSNGKEGVKLWKSHHPHLVFLDILMPEMDGPQVLEQVGKTHEEKVVMMSAHRELSQIQMIPGVDLFISKPFENIRKVFEQAENLFQTPPADNPFFKNP